MAWSDVPGAGFTTGRPWLRLPPDVATRNVEAQAGRAGSVMATYQALLGVRRRLPALALGALEDLRVDDRDVLRYERVHGDDRALVAVNFAPAERRLRLSTGAWRRAFSTDHGAGGSAEAAPIGPDQPLSLRPFEGVVLVKE
jgi:alpha-glucosidase